MKTLIFLDDERNFEDVTWINYPDYKETHIVRNTSTFFDCLQINFVTGATLKDLAFSFDHDLAEFVNGFEKTGKTAANMLLNFMLEYNFDPADLDYHVHSKNPVGKENIEGLLEGYKNYYSGCCV